MRFGGVVAALVVGGCGPSGADPLPDELAAARDAIPDHSAHADAPDRAVSRPASIDARIPAVDAGAPSTIAYFIETEPSGATVTTSRINYGRTPVTIHLAAPIVEVLVELPGYKPRHETLRAQRPSALYLLRRK